MLTKRQKQVLNFVKSFSKKNGYAPSLEEIKERLGLSSISTAHFHISNLKKLGLIRKIKNEPRAIEIKKKKSDLISIPLVGTIAAGSPIEAIEDREIIEVPRSRLSRSGEHFALRVAGDSMIDEGIFDGDTVIIKHQNTADNGQMVVAVIDDNQATLKKLYKEKDRFRLQPANQKMLPFFRKEVEVRGVVVKIIRNLDNTNEIQALEKYKQIKVVHKPPSKKVTQTIFTNSNYQIDNIYNLDCLELMNNIKDQSIDLIFADPPYNLSKSNFKMRFVKSGGSDLNTYKGHWDNFNENDFETFTKKWLQKCYRILKNQGAIWVAGTYHNIYLTGYLMQKIGFDILNEVLWHKTDATPNLSCTRFVADHENFIWAKKKGRGNTFNYDEMKTMNGGKQMRSIWPKGKTTGGKKIHPTQKPEWLLERIILATSKKHELVFDPFMGSGTTAFVAKALNRHYLGSEINKVFYKQSLKRLNSI